MDSDLTITYLKDNCELLLRVDRGTAGWLWIYRRMPSDGAGERRIISLLNRGRVAPENIRIRVLLFPPEVLTLALYLPTDLDPNAMRRAVCSQILPGLPYPDAYDLQTLRLSSTFIDGNQLVIASVLGKAIIPGIRRILNELVPQVCFVGDGLQFLKLGSSQQNDSGMQTYQVVLRRGDRFFIAGFQGGCHTSSCSLSHATQQMFASTTLQAQQSFANLRSQRELLEAPTIQTLPDSPAWRKIDLPRHAFPVWYLTQGALNNTEALNHVPSLAENHTAWKRRQNSARTGAAANQHRIPFTA